MPNEEMADDILRNAAEKADLVFMQLGEGKAGLIFHNIDPRDLSELAAPQRVHSFLIEALEKPESMGIVQLRETLEQMQIHFRDPGGMTRANYKAFSSKDPELPADGLYVLMVLKCPYNADVVYRASVKRQGWIPQAGQIVDATFLRQLEKHQEEVEYKNKRESWQSPAVDIVVSPGASVILAPDALKYGRVIISESDIEDGGLFATYPDHILDHRSRPLLGNSICLTLYSSGVREPSRSGWQKEVHFDFPKSQGGNERGSASFKATRDGVHVSNSSNTWMGLSIEGKHFPSA